MVNGKEFTIVDRETVYQGFFKLEKYGLKHTLYTGGWSPVLHRELFRRGNCVAVLLYDPNLDKVVLIEQFRVGAILQDENPWLLEIVAGAIESGETPAEVAVREAQEEAGCVIEDLLTIHEFYTTPGGASERITLFCARVDASEVGGVHGLKEEQEDILVKAVPADQAYRMVERGEIDSAIPILAIQWLMLNRQKIQSRWLNS